MVLSAHCNTSKNRLCKNRPIQHQFIFLYLPPNTQSNTCMLQNTVNYFNASPPQNICFVGPGPWSTLISTKDNFTWVALPRWHCSPREGGRSLMTKDGILEGYPTQYENMVNMVSSTHSTQLSLRQQMNTAWAGVWYAHVKNNIWLIILNYYLKEQLNFGLKTWYIPNIQTF